MGKDIKTAVLLSTYNGSAYVEQQLKSIFAQEGAGNITVLVRDDGSIDDTLAILWKVRQRHQTLKIIEGENLGLVRSFFALLSVAVQREFDYIAFCDQDDCWLTDKLASALKMLQAEDSNEPILYGGCSKLTDKELRDTGKETQHKIRELSFYNTAIQNICPGHSQVLNLALAQKIVEKTTSLDGVYSSDYWIATAASVVGKIVFDNTPHTLYRQHGDNQLGYGTGAIGRLRTHLARLKKGEGRQMAVQLGRFAEQYSDCLNIEQKEEISAFFAAQDTILHRLGYIFRCKLHRQKQTETLAFKLLYLLGYYQTNK